jgi:hypothetical protein
MNPLTRVLPDAADVPIVFNSAESLKARSELAVKVAQCIGISAEVEIWLGVALANLMQADFKAAIAMYSSVQSRSAQIGMLRAAAETALPQDESDIFEAILSASIIPAIKDRDKLAHWVWGLTDQLPNDLLLIEPQETRDYYIGFMKPAVRTTETRDHIFVVTDNDLQRILARLEKAKENIGRLNGCLWGQRSTPAREELFQKLSSEPGILQAIDRLQKARKSSP